jgi:hypothetical protein
MAVRSVIDIDLNDGVFLQFANKFKQYQDALSKTPEAWKKVTGEIDGSRKSFDDLVAKAAVKLAQTRLIAAAEKAAADQLDRATRETTKQAQGWANISRDTKKFAGNIAGATTSLLRWASLTGVISGVLGAGGLFGIERLAQSAGNQRRSALGFGVTPGEQSSFEVTYGRVVDPNQFLSGVNEALHDVTKRVGLYGAGLTEGDLRGKDTAQVSAELIPALKRLADQTPASMLAQVMQARHLDQFITLQDFERLKNTPASEINKYGPQYQANIKNLDLTQRQQKAWQDLQVQLDLAWRSIQRVLVVGLSGLAGPLTHLSGAFGDVVKAFAASPQIKKFLEDVATGLDHFASYIGTPDFAKSVSTFAADIGRLAKSLEDALPGLELVLKVVGGAAHVAQAVVGPWVNGRPLSHDEAERYNTDHPEHQIPVPAAPAPFSLWNYLFGPGSPSAPYTFPNAAPSAPGSSPSYFFPAAFRTGGGSSRTTEAHDFFRNAGWNEAQTAGLLANIGAESGFNPQAFNASGGGQGAQGIAQWRGDRIANFRRLFGHDPQQGTFQEQLLFIQWELMNTEQDAGTKLRAAQSASQAGAIVNQDYERSGADGGQRAQAARQYAHNFRDRSVQVQIRNNTGGNAHVSVAQLAI